MIADAEVVDAAASRASRALMRLDRRRAAVVPRATSGWLVTTISAKPASLQARRARPATPGRISSSSSAAGGYGLPSRTIARLSTPSRSRKTAAAGSPRSIPTSSASAFSSGCETSRCQTTAWNASVCGVTCLGFTVGTITQASATLAV